MSKFVRVLLLVMFVQTTSLCVADTEKVIDVHDLTIRELHQELLFCEKASVHSFNICVQQDIVDGESTQTIRPWWNAVSYVTSHTNTVEPSITSVERLDETSLRIHYRD